MFGIYQVEYKGQTYFGNVSLREAHVFRYGSNCYLVDVERMAAYPISSRLAALIARAALPSSGLIPESDMIELRKLKLIAEEAPSLETSPEDESGQPPLKAEYPVTSIALFLAQECNLRCVYCYGDAGEYAGKGMMSEETACLAVDWLIANSKNTEKVNICFFGGEPLLNFPVMKKIVAYAKEKTAQKGKQVTFSITTNGSLLNDEIISFLKNEKINPLISFDGPPEYQNRQRPFKDGRGSYDTVHSNVQKLRAVFPHLQARATVYGDANPFSITEGMEQAGFTSCLLTRASPILLNAQCAGTPPSEWLKEQTLQRMLDFNHKEVEQLLAAIRERKIDKDCPSALLLGITEMASEKKHYYGCGIGKGMAAISATGDIYPCQRFVGQEKMCMGNIGNYSAGGLNDYYRAVVDQFPECRYCWARYFCGGGCSYANKAHTGDMHRPDSLDCRERKATFEGLIHVYCQLDDSDKEYVKDILKDVTERHP